MRILVTGAAGFIGSHLVEKLACGNNQVMCLVRDENKGKILEKKYGVSYVVADIVKFETLNALDKDYEIIYHLAAMGHVSAVSDEDSKKFIEINEGGTKNLINYFKDSQTLKKFIHFSSTAAMGPAGEAILDESSIPNPVTPYQISKCRSEKLSLQAFANDGFPTVVIRPCMVYGVGGYGEFYKFCRLMKKGVFPKVGLGKNLTPLVNVEDLVQAAVKAMENGKCGEVYIIASEESIPMDNLHSIIMMNLGYRRPYIFVPAGLALLGAKALETGFALLKKEPIVTYRNIKSTITDRTFNISKAKEELGYQPCISFEKGIKETIEWYKKERKI